MAGPNYTVIPNDWQNLEYIISDLSSRIIDEDASFTDYLLKDGTRALTGNWDAGDYYIQTSYFISDVAIGTAPYQCTSTTLNTNLNADYLDNQHGSYYATAGGWTAGSILFANAAGDISEDNSHLYFDYTNYHVGIGTNTPNAGITLYGGGDISKLRIYDIDNDDGSSEFMFLKIRSSSIVQDDDTLGSLVFRGYDSGAYRNAGLIKCEVDGTPGPSDMPARLTFWTTPDGSADSVERMRIDNAGYVGIGIVTPTSPFHIRSTTANQFRVDYSASFYTYLNVESDGDWTFRSNVNGATGSLGNNHLLTTGTVTAGNIIDSGLTASLGVYTDGSKQLTSTPPTSGVLGYWSRTGTTLTQANANDDLSLGSGDVVSTGYGRFDTGVGIGTNPSSGLLHIVLGATDTSGIYMTQAGYTGTSTNYGVQNSRTISTPSGSAAFNSYAMNNSLTNNYTIDGASFVNQNNYGLSNTLTITGEHTNISFGLTETNSACINTLTRSGTIYSNAPSLNQIFNYGVLNTINDSVSYNGSGQLDIFEYGITCVYNISGSQLSGTFNRTVHGIRSYVNSSMASGNETLYGIYSRVGSSGGSTSTSIGIYIDTITGDTAWAFYNNSASNSLIGKDSIKACFGDAGASDGYIQWDGTNLDIFSHAAIDLTTDTTPLTLNFDDSGANTGVLTWTSASDIFTFYDDIIMDTAEKIIFRQSTEGIYSQAAGYLDIFAATAIRFGNSAAGAPTTYLTVENDGDTYWAGDGSGLPFGSCYDNGSLSWSQTNAVQNTWYNIADANIDDNAKLNLVTHDGSGKLTVSKAGKYLITYSLSLDGSVANGHYEAGIEINGSGSAQTPGQCHYDGVAASAELTLASCAILDLAASDTIEVSVRTTDATTPTITVEHFNLAVVQLGG